MIVAIAAVDNNFGIGYNNKLLMSIPKDMELFKKLTTGNTVVMGRKTWDSLLIKPLPNRNNIVISTQNLETNGEFTCLSLEEAKDFLSKDTEETIFIIGGSQIYKELLPYCDRVVLTRMHKEFENVDSYFSNIDEDSKWKRYTSTYWREHEGVPYYFQAYKTVE